MAHTFILAMLLLLLTTIPALAGSRPLVVDRDGVECPHADFTSIQAAVGAAPPGGMILVCPDHYVESVTVTKPLTLRALRAEETNRVAACFDATPPPPDPSRDAIIDGGGKETVPFTVSLDAEEVTLDGFVVTGGRFGIQTSPQFSGYRITDNLVQDNRRAIELNANGQKETRVHGNCVRFNNGGVLNELGDLHHARIDHNGFFSQGESGVDLSGLAGSRERVRIEHNRMEAVAGAVTVNDSVDSRIAHNESIDDDISYLIGGRNTRLAIVHNRAEGGFHGIVFFAGAFLPPAPLDPTVASVVTHNSVEGKVRSGIRAFFGVNLVGSTVAHNAVTSNGQDGIRIEGGGNAGNVIAHNRASQNAEHDCHDDTLGSGTAGTANTWTHNFGVTENRPGLCRD